MADEGVLGRVEVVMTPVQHWPGRSLSDRMQTLWSGYAVFAPDLHLYFSGDTEYSRDFIDTRERFKYRQADTEGGGFDMAPIAIGAYEPRWIMKVPRRDAAATAASGTAGPRPQNLPAAPR